MASRISWWSSISLNIVVSLFFSSSSQRCAGLHGQVALGISGPPPDGLVAFLLAADLEGGDIEQRRHGTEAKALDLRTRQFSAQQVEQQRRSAALARSSPASPLPRSRTCGRSGCGGR